MSVTKNPLKILRQLGDALKIGQSLDLMRPGSDIRNVVIAGMGGFRHQRQPGLNH